MQAIDEVQHLSAVLRQGRIGEPNAIVCRRISAGRGGKHVKKQR